MQGEERRRHIRVFLPGGQIRLITGGLCVLVGRAIDLSLGGIKFVANADLKSGDELQFELTLPTGMKLPCIAKVVHCEAIPDRETEMSFGVQFLDLSEEAKFELGEYIMKQRATQDGILHDELE